MSYIVCWIYNDWIFEPVGCGYAPQQFHCMVRTLHALTLRTMVFALALQKLQQLDRVEIRLAA